MNAYAVKHKDISVVRHARSGGMFFALAENVLSRSGVVYGCIPDDAFTAVHSRAASMDELYPMHGSKYVQSALGDTFKMVKKDLEEGKLALFSGTSCQVAGLQRYLQKDYERLICIDIACYGVPSPKLWKHYLKWQSKGKPVEAVSFRNKEKYGWRASVETLMVNGKEVNSTVWSRIFHGRNALRPSCFECPFKTTHHPGDITLADYWGIENVMPEFDDNKGVSLVLVNSDKGALSFEDVKCDLLWKETRIEDAMQPVFEGLPKRPETREQFWSDFDKRGFAYIAREYGGWPTPSRRILQKVKKSRPVKKAKQSRLVRKATSTIMKCLGIRRGGDHG